MKLCVAPMSTKNPTSFLMTLPLIRIELTLVTPAEPLADSSIDGEE